MRNKGLEDHSVEEIRFLLVDKRRVSRNIRLDRPGRVCQGWVFYGIQSNVLVVCLFEF